MPLLYGEGTKAFLRLQLEIMRSVHDLSLFAWGFQDTTLHEGKFLEESGDARLFREAGFLQGLIHLHDVLADDPQHFRNSGRLRSQDLYARESNISEAKGAINISMPLLNVPKYVSSHTAENTIQYLIMLLPCQHADRPQDMIGIILCAWGLWTPGTLRRYRRVANDPRIFTFFVPCADALNAVTKRFWIDPKETIARQTLLHVDETLHRTIVIRPNPFAFGDSVLVHPPSWTWNATGSGLQLDKCPRDEDMHALIGLFDRERCILLCVALQLAGYYSTDGDKLRMSAISTTAEMAEPAMELVASGFEDGWLSCSDKASIMISGGHVGATVSSKLVLNRVITTLDLERLPLEEPKVIDLT